MQEISANGIKVYSLPDVDEDEDEEYKEEVRLLKAAMPFAVSGSTTIIEAKGKKVRGRLYPWGVVEIENPDHSDFVKLRTMLITHMQDLQEVTQEVHYENYRLQKLASEARAGMKAELLLDQQGVDKDEMKRILQEKEAELKKMQELMAKMQAEMQTSKVWSIVLIDYILLKDFLGVPPVLNAVFMICFLDNDKYEPWRIEVFWCSTFRPNSENRLSWNACLSKFSYIYVI